ncbi:hypothetical protein AB0K51_11480 [Kitasatospora sp. NPDC049285]|uniref:hypothetical protein n=1 Tax=Kitasatospora sp. NPDC049285 TaxID=3157096 RepID=UPI003445A673
MNTDQRVVRRSPLLSRLLTVAAATAALLLVYAVVRDNLPDGTGWPRLLDVQSATTTAVATGGAALARAQYARAVRPALGFSGRVADGLAPDGRLVWAAHVLNAAQDVAVVTDIAYAVRLRAADGTAEPVGPWTALEAVVARIEGRGLAWHRDFFLVNYGPGAPFGPQANRVIAWFTEAAMAQVEEVYLRLRVADRVGDEHERILRCLKNAERHPTGPTPQVL